MPDDGPKRAFTFAVAVPADVSDPARLVAQLERTLNGDPVAMTVRARRVGESNAEVVVTVRARSEAAAERAALACVRRAMALADEVLVGGTPLVARRLGVD